MKTEVLTSKRSTAPSSRSSRTPRTIGTGTPLIGGNCESLCADYILHLTFIIDECGGCSLPTPRVPLPAARPPPPSSFVWNSAPRGRLPATRLHLRLISPHLPRRLGLRLPHARKVPHRSLRRTTQKIEVSVLCSRLGPELTNGTAFQILYRAAGVIGSPSRLRQSRHFLDGRYVYLRASLHVLPATWINIRILAIQR